MKNKSFFQHADYSWLRNIYKNRHLDKRHLKKKRKKNYIIRIIHILYSFLFGKCIRLFVYTFSLKEKKVKWKKLIFHFFKLLQQKKEKWRKMKKKYNATNNKKKEMRRAHTQTQTSDMQKRLARALWFYLIKIKFRLYI